MVHMDADYAAQAIQRLNQIAEDAQPRWGKMSKQEMLEHLIWAVKMSLGRTEKPVPFAGNWFTVHIIRPISLSGVLPIPKNLKLPKALHDQGINGREAGDIQALGVLLEEYLQLVQAGEFTPPPHPVLGELGIDGWSRLHVFHFDHHLKQFGV